VTALVRSELLKVRTTRGWWAYLIVIVGLTGAGVAAEIGSTESASRGNVGFQLGLLDTIGLAVIMAVILGITIVTTEFRHGTVTPTFLATPVRERVLLAKTIAGVLVAIFFAFLALVVVLAVALPWLAILDVDVNVETGDAARRVGRQFLSTVLWLLMGVAIGTLVQSQVAALVGTLIWIFLGESLIFGLFVLLDVEGLSAYLPFRALDAADGTGGENLLSYGGGVAVALGWIALLGALGTLRVRRRDIT
jgi:ABC-type transport system involved in multi-copper enzyme maturation permease subunit